MGPQITRECFIRTSFRDALVWNFPRVWDDVNVHLHEFHLREAATVAADRRYDAHNPSVVHITVKNKISWRVKGFRVQGSTLNPKG